MTRTIEPPLNVAELRIKIDRIANALSVNTFIEAGVCDDKMLTDIINLIDSLFENCGVPSDHWPHTPLMDRCVNTVNSLCNTRISGFHFWELLMGSRKDGRLPASGVEQRDFAAAFNTPRPGIAHVGVSKEPAAAEPARRCVPKNLLKGDVLTWNLIFSYFYSLRVSIEVC